MSKSTQHFMNETENLFNVLAKLNSVKISVIHVSHDERLLTIEEPSNKQIKALNFSVCGRDDTNDTRYIFMGKIKVVWKAQPVIKTLTKMKRRGFLWLSK